MELCIDPAGIRRKAPLAHYIEQLTPRLERMACHYARRTGIDRDDLLQEAWQGLIEGWSRMDVRIGSPDQFLILCAKWRLLSHLRRSRRRSTSPLQTEIQVRDGELAAADVRLDLELAGATLPLTQQRIIGCLVSGMTWREAGQQLGCTSANIAYHVRQIRAALSGTAA